MDPREYNPSPAEIRRQCRRIQATWDDAERYRRTVKIPQPSNRHGESYEREPYTVPLIRVCEIAVAS